MPPTRKRPPKSMAPRPGDPQPSPPPPPRRALLPGGEPLFPQIEPGTRFRPREFIDLNRKDGDHAFSVRVSLIAQIHVMEGGAAEAQWSILQLATGEKLHVRQSRDQILQLLGEML